MRITSAGNVGIGTTAPAKILSIRQPADNNGIRINHATRATSTFWDIELSGVNNAGLAFKQNDGSTTATSYVAGRDTHLFYTNDSERMRITSAGRVGIGLTAPAAALHVSGINVGAAIDWQSTDPAGGRHFRWVSLNVGGFALEDITAGTERARIDASGNLLVGKTSTSGAVVGVSIEPAGLVKSTRGSNISGFFNREGSLGDIVRFARDDTTVGNIGVPNSGELYIANSGGQSGIKLTTISSLVPCNADGSNSDDDQDLGAPTVRWDDIYATNGTIQTSDRNEKQDIEELDEAERRVAVACKGLLRKFRWKSAVEEKGDDARIHFGIIAQDLQTAFEAEGLDAGRYAMFINSTWTEEETGEERSRMGVRYSELLAFIIAAI
jgi:hypothetical protein